MSPGCKERKPMAAPQNLPPADLQPTLRQRAEQALAEQKDHSHEPKTLEDAQRLLVELQVHQIELELQYEELCQTQSQLAAEREKYADLYNFAPVAYFTFDNQDIILDLNLAAAELLGTERRYLLNHPITPYLAPESLHIFIQNRQQALDNGMPQTCEMKLRLRGNTTVFVQARTVALPAEPGTPTRWRSVLADITERKKIEAALSESESKLDSILNSLHDVVYSLDANTYQLIHVNPAVERIFGRPRREFLTDPMAYQKYIHPEDYPWVASSIQQVFEHGQAEWVFRIVRADDETRWVSSRSHLIRDEHGLPMRIDSIMTDITDHKRTEEALQKLNAELEQRVAERTAQLEAINQELEAFSYSVSHDLRAPLRHLNGYSQLLVEEGAGQIGGNAEMYLTRIQKAASHMGELIDALLNLSRLTRGKLYRQPVNLSALVHSIAQALRESEPQRRVEFVIQDGLIAQADETLLQNMLENLLNNAWKFSGHQPLGQIEFGKLSMPSEASPPSQNGLTIYFVRDNGVGFDMAYSNKLFKAFQRLHANDEFPGTGIGLATVQRIVHRHGGKVWAESQVGQGATFFFSLP
jgi:PAS domain S-box-containing protein